MFRPDMIVSKERGFNKGPVNRPIKLHSTIGAIREARGEARRLRRSGLQIDARFAQEEGGDALAVM